jgi:hypothetical protein
MKLKMVTLHAIVPILLIIFLFRSCNLNYHKMEQIRKLYVQCLDSINFCQCPPT